MEKQELIVDFLMFQGVQDREKTGTVTIRQIRVNRPPRNAGIGSYEDEEELKAIFERTFGPVKRYKEPQFKRTFSSKSDNGSYYRNSSSAKKKEKNISL